MDSQGLLPKQFSRWFLIIIRPQSLLQSRVTVKAWSRTRSGTRALLRRQGSKVRHTCLNGLCQTTEKLTLPTVARNAWGHSLAPIPDHQGHHLNPWQQNAVQTFSSERLPIISQNKYSTKKHLSHCTAGILFPPYSFLGDVQLFKSSFQFLSFVSRWCKLLRKYYLK